MLRYLKFPIRHINLLQKRTLKDITLKNLTLNEQKRSLIYDKLRDTSSTYSKTFNEIFIDKIDKSNSIYGGECTLADLALAKKRYDYIFKCNTIWNQLPRQFVSYHSNTEKLLNQKLLILSDDIYRFKREDTINKIKMEINDDLDVLLL